MKKRNIIFSLFGSFDAYFWVKMRQKKRRSLKTEETNNFEMKWILSLYSSSSMYIKMWNFPSEFQLVAWKIIISYWIGCWQLATVDESYFIFHLLHSWFYFIVNECHIPYSTCGACSSVLLFEQNLRHFSWIFSF